LRAVRRFDGYWMAPGSARTLAALRLAVGLFAVGYLAVRLPNFMSVADFAEAQFAPTGVVQTLGSPLAPWLARALPVITLVAGAAFVAGWRFRVSGPVFALLLLWVVTYRNSWGQIFHTENLLVLHAIVLALAPSADAWSIDARQRGDEGRGHGEPYGWPVRLMCVLTVLAYVIAGWAKLDAAGIDWVASDALRNQVAYDNLRKDVLGDHHSPLGAWLVGHGWAFRPLAVLTLAVELGAPLTLLGRRAAVAWVAAAWAFHAGILVTMAIVFPYQLLGVAFLPFLRVEPAAEALRRKAGALRTRTGRLEGAQPRA
jgi:hypothetical protein